MESFGHKTCRRAGCGAIPSVKTRQFWAWAKERGHSSFEGLCAAHCKDLIKRTELARLDREKKEAKLCAQGLSVTETAVLEAQRLMKRQTLSRTEVAKILKVTVPEVDGLAERTFLLAMCANPEDRNPRILKSSVATLAEMILADSDLLYTLPSNLRDRFARQKKRLGLILKTNALD